MHVAHLRHGAGEQNVSRGGGQDNNADSAPGINFFHGCSLALNSSEAWPSFKFAVPGHLRRVRTGPCVTKPTPEEMSRIPNHRNGVTCSCKRKRAISAISTYPRDV